jgi:hypothetical protein
VNLIEGREIMNWWEKPPLVRMGWEVGREIMNWWEKPPFFTWVGKYRWNLRVIYCHSWVF